MISNEGSTNVKKNSWRTEEKTRYLHLLAKHGKDFSAIARDLGSRSVSQCRNYF